MAKQWRFVRWWWDTVVRVCVCACIYFKECIFEKKWFAELTSHTLLRGRGERAHVSLILPSRVWTFRKLLLAKDYFFNSKNKDLFFYRYKSVFRRLQSLMPLWIQVDSYLQSQTKIQPGDIPIRLRMEFRDCGLGKGECDLWIHKHFEDNNSTLKTVTAVSISGKLE